MRRNLIIVGVVGIAVFGIFLIVVAGGRSAGPAITIRHVKSIQSGETTRLIFEISNHTASSYVFFPLTVDVRRGTVWAPSYKFSDPPIGSLIGTLGPSSFISYQPEVMSLPKGVPLRLRISANKNLTGLEGFVGRVQLSILYYRAGGRRPFSLYPFGNKSAVWGPPIEVVSEEFEESPKNPAER